MAEARFRAIFDSQFQMIGLLNPDGTVLEANRAACEIAGITRDAFVGRRFWDGFEWPDGERLGLRREVAEAANGMMIRREVEIISADGRGTRMLEVIIGRRAVPIR
jgi:PAS domain S-box-containing protein